MTEFRVLIAAPKRKTIRLIETVFNQLHSMQWTFVEALDGQQAAFKAENQIFDLVVLDDGLQKQSSQRVWRLLRESKEHQQTPVIWIGRALPEVAFEEERFQKRLQVVDTLAPGPALEAIVISLDYLANVRNQAFQVRVLHAGELLMREGDEADFVFILKVGRLKVTRLQNSKVVEVGWVEPGEFVGEMAYLSGESRSASVSAEVLSEMIAIPVAHFETTLANRPSWAHAMMKNLARRLKQANIFTPKSNLS